MGLQKSLRAQRIAFENKLPGIVKAVEVRDLMALKVLALNSVGGIRLRDRVNRLLAAD